MATYICKIRNQKGKIITEHIKAGNKAEVLRMIHHKNYRPVYIRKKIFGSFSKLFVQQSPRLKEEDMLLFYIQLSNMIGAGVSVIKSLQIISEQIENIPFQKTIQSISEDINSGTSLSEAFAKYTNFFPELFIDMVRASELSGKLDEILDNYAQLFEHQMEIKRKVQSAFTYPIILLIFGLLIIVFLIVFFIPKFIRIFMDMGAALPLPTIILYQTGEFTKHYWYFVCTGIPLIFWGIKAYIHTKNGRLRFDQFKLKFPVFGPLNRKIAISKFSKTFGLLLDSHVPILTALQSTQNITGNKVFSQVLDKACAALESGEGMVEPLRASGEFPVDAIQMIAIGEEGGNLPKMLFKIASFYDVLVNHLIKKLTTMIEPVFLVGIGGIIGMIMASILLPIFNIISVMH